MKNQLRIAFLIDAENKSAVSFEQHLSFLSGIGEVVRTRAYADWGKNNPKSWLPYIESGLVEKRFLLKAVGNNAADITLIREASQLITEGSVNAIAIYSRDGDYLMAMEAWKGQGARVIAFDMPGVSLRVLENADFVINGTTGCIKRKEEITPRLVIETINRLRSIVLPGLKVVTKKDLLPAKPKVEIGISLDFWRNSILKILKNAGGRMLVSQLGDVIRKEIPAFNPSIYQCKKLTAFLRRYIPEVVISQTGDKMTYWAELKN